jgi:hypothetical protein
MIAFADDHVEKRLSSRTARVPELDVSRDGEAFYRNPAALAVLLEAATVRRRRLLGDPTARPGASFQPGPPDVLTLRDAGACLPTGLRDTLSADVHHRLKCRLAEMFQMIDELQLSDPSTGEPDAGSLW